MTSTVSSKSAPFAQGVVELLNILTPENKNQFLGKLSLKELMALLPQLKHPDLQSRVMDRIERIVEKRGNAALQNVTQGQDKVIEKLFQRLMKEVKSEINQDISKIDRRVLEHLFKKDVSSETYRANRKILKTPPSGKTAAQQVAAIKKIVGMIKSVSPPAQQPQTWSDLIALFEDGISKLKYLIF
ncbi:MAG: hypothetical protein LLG04_07480 [Parachlamydia sp.]|nr:hypothetical protein [Parachlamydia sp.]